MARPGAARACLALALALTVALSGVGAQNDTGIDTCPAAKWKVAA